uniref:Neprosin PEP catalytic domain-containing protein n=1 Tax=Oryza glumipatula TaxID=40148 RepID=A0A0E0BHR7_9ORYZ
MGYKGWTIKTFLLLHLLIFSVDPTKEEVDYNLIVKTIQTADGQTFACVSFKSQPSLRHPLLMNHTTQLMPPISFPHSTDADEGSKFGISNVEMSEIECPPGTVPILTSYNGSMSTRSFDKSIYSENGNDKGNRQMAAVVTVPSTFYGLQTSISIWEPDLGTGRPPRFSGAIVILKNGGSRVAVGWSVDPHLYGDNHVHFEIAWVDNDKSCINLRCAGFVQMSKKAIPGIIIRPVSTVNGKQYIIRVKIIKFMGDWVLKVGDEIVGYWPSKLLTHMSEAADVISWIGVVEAALGQPFPPMGSGQPADEGETKAAFFADAKVIDASGSFATPALKTINTIATEPKCYEVGRPYASDDGLQFYYGGAGCSPSQSIK